MATKLFFRNALASSTRKPGITNVQWPKKIGSGPYVNLALSTTAGGAATSFTRASVAGPTAGLEFGGGTTYGSGTIPACWISEPVSADFTLSGTLTFNFWAAENNMADNISLQCDLYKFSADSDTVTVVKVSANVTEVAVTTRALYTWTATPTSTAFNKGDRIMAIIWIDDAGTMGAGGSCNIGIDGGTGGADGDSWVQINETVTFLTTTPSGSTYYLRTDADTPVVTKRSARKLLTTRGSTSVESLAAWSAGTGTAGADNDNDLYQSVIPFRSEHAYVAAGGSGVIAMDSNTTTARRNAQGFQIPTGWGDPDIRQMHMSINIIGPDDGPLMDVHADSSGQPGSSIAASTFTGYGPNNFCRFANHETLVKGTQYWGVLKNDTAGVFDITPNGFSTGTYADGIYATSNNSGGSWTTDSAKDMSLVVTYGYPVDWYTPALAAQTLSGLVKMNIRARQGTGSSNIFSIWAELAVCNDDGTSAVVWANAKLNSSALGRMSGTTTDTAYTMWFAGDDRSITANQRIRLRVYYCSDDIQGSLQTGTNYGAISLDGPSSSAAGDSWLQFSQTLTEAGGGGGATEDPFPYVGAGYYPTQG
jgi:hypothetical protein